MRIAVVGAGSLGIVIGGLLARAGRDVELVAAHKETADALNRDGAVLQGAIEAAIPVKALTPGEMRGTYDCALLLTKLDALDVSLRQLAPHLYEKSIICALQNGMPEEAVAAVIGRERTVGGVVLLGAARQGANVSRITSAAGMLSQAFEIGELDGGSTPRIETLCGILSGAGGCHVVPNLLNLRWAKLLINTTIGALTAALGSGSRRILETPEALGLTVRTADETIRVAHAAGRSLAALQGHDMEALAIPHGGRPEDRFALFREFFLPWGDGRSSMYQDLAAGRKTEVRHLNGYVSARGRSLGIPTPCNDAIVHLVSEAEENGTVPTFETNLPRALALAAQIPA